MSNVIIGIIGVILFIGLAAAGAVFLGPQFMNKKIETEATKYLLESSQISKAVNDYASDNGKLPIEAGKEPIDVLVEQKYLKYAPTGGSSPWVHNASAGALVTPVSGAVDKATKVCVAAREKAKMPNPSNIYKCDGSNAPGGKLSQMDPCCLP